MFDLLLNRAQGRKKHSLHGLQLLVWQTTVGRLLQCPLLEFFNKRPTIVDRLVRNVLIPFNLFFPTLILAKKIRGKLENCSCVLTV